jgi:hypothetical protein
MNGLEYMNKICPTTSRGKDPNREDVADAFDDGIAEGYAQAKKDIMASGKKAIHKKTGNLCKIVTDNFMFKQDGKWIKNLVLYEALYDNPDGKYFARTKEDFEEHFEIVEE